jgi:hypothetical protein
MDTNFSIKLNPRLIPIARQMHQVSRVGDRRTGPRQSFESYLSDLVEVAIVERTDCTAPETRRSSLLGHPGATAGSIFDRSAANGRSVEKSAR